MKPTELLEMVKGQTGKRKGVCISTLFKERGLDPTNEEHRKEVWNTAQTLATLVREGYLSLDTSTRERYYELNN